MRKTPNIKKKARLSHAAQQIREAGVLTSKGIEQGHSQSEIPKSRRKNFASFGSE